MQEKIEFISENNGIERSHNLRSVTKGGVVTIVAHIPRGTKPTALQGGPEVALVPKKGRIK